MNPIAKVGSVLYKAFFGAYNDLRNDPDAMAYDLDEKFAEIKSKCPAVTGDVLKEFRRISGDQTLVQPSQAAPKHYRAMMTAMKIRAHTDDVLLDLDNDF